MKRLTQLLQLALLASLMVSRADGKQEIFVAVNGRDSNPGTKSRPVSTWKPYRDGIWVTSVPHTVRETGDHGPFNSWGRERYWCLLQSHGPASHGAGNVKVDARETTIIRNNYFREQRGWGIDLDDGSANFLVTKNLCLGISVKLREGDYRTVGPLESSRDWNDKEHWARSRSYAVLV